MIDDAWLWIRVHAHFPLILIFLASSMVEIAFGTIPVVLPWSPDTDLQWGLLLPLITIASVVNMMHTGLGFFERSHRTGWRGVRAIWCLVLAAVASLPAPFTLDGLTVTGSIRNRVILLAITVIASLVVPATLAILVPTVVMFVAMLFAGAGAGLVAGASPIGTVLGSLLQRDCTSSQAAVAGVLLLAAVIAYAFGYPPHWSAKARGEAS